MGEQGELVITAPMPSMPVSFWNDPSGDRYRAAYFDDFPGVWRHGDWVTFTERGSCVISGRSDATLNRGGVRIGTAEFYAVVESIPTVVDSLVVHLDEDGPAAPVRGPGARGRSSTKPCVRGSSASCGRRSRRATFRTRSWSCRPSHARCSGKKLEVPVKRILTGTPPEVAASRESLADPTSLDAFVARAATQEADR